MGLNTYLSSRFWSVEGSSANGQICRCGRNGGCQPMIAVGLAVDRWLQTVVVEQSLLDGLKSTDVLNWLC